MYAIRSYYAERSGSARPALFSSAPSFSVFRDAGPPVLEPVASRAYRGVAPAGAPGVPAGGVGVAVLSTRAGSAAGAGEAVGGASAFTGASFV